MFHIRVAKWYRHLHSQPAPALPKEYAAIEFCGSMCTEAIFEKWFFLRRTDAMWSFLLATHTLCMGGTRGTEMPTFIYHFALCFVVDVFLVQHKRMVDERTGWGREDKIHAHVFAIKIAHVLLMAAKQHFYSLRHGLFAFKSLGHF